MKVCLCAHNPFVVLMERRTSFCFPGSRSVAAGSLVSACDGESCDAALEKRNGRTGVLVGVTAEMKKQ